MLGPSKHRSECSQSVIGWIIGPPMEELDKVPKELKGVCNPIGGTTMLTNQYPLGQLLIHMQLETQVLGAGGYLLVNIVVPTIGLQTPLSSLGTLSSFFIGGPVIYPITDCEHSLLCLLGPCIVSQETAT